MERLLQQRQRDSRNRQNTSAAKCLSLSATRQNGLFWYREELIRLERLEVARKDKQMV